MKKFLVAFIIITVVVSYFVVSRVKLPVRIFNTRKPTNDFYMKLAFAGEDIVDPKIKYDAKYQHLAYPGGDVPATTGVCADVIIRAYRKLKIDLQVLVHEDMKQNFNKYPNKWGLTSPDTNIDHRRVYNLNTFFKRKGVSLPITKNSKDYTPGDIVIWRFYNGMTHIGLVTSVKAPSGNYYIVHNWGGGQVMEDVLFNSEIYGHYKYKK